MNKPFPVFNLLPALLLAGLLILTACGGDQSTPTASPATARPTAAPTLPPTKAPEPTEATSSEPVSGMPMVRVNEATILRTGPRATYERVAPAEPGDMLVVLGRSGASMNLWYQVELPDGTVAWAWSRVTTLIPADAQIPEVEPPPAP